MPDLEARSSASFISSNDGETPVSRIRSLMKRSSSFCLLVSMDRTFPSDSVFTTVLRVFPFRVNQLWNIGSILAAPGLLGLSQYTRVIGAVRSLHQTLADQESPNPEGPETVKVPRLGNAAFGNEVPVFRQKRRKALGRRPLGAPPPGLAGVGPPCRGGGGGG